MGLFSSNEYINALNPEQRSQAHNKYLDSLHLGDANPVGKDHFDNYVKLRRKNLDGFFVGSKDESELSMQKQLKLENPNAQKVREAITAALATSPNVNQMQADYVKSIAAFNKLIKDIPGRYRPHDLIAGLSEIRNEARGVIVQQHTDEKTALKLKLDEPAVTEALASALSVGIGSNELKLHKEQLLNDLSSGHQKQLKNFDDETNKEVDKLHKAASLQREQQSLLAVLYDQNKVMRELIKQHYVEHNRTSVPAEAIFDGENSAVMLANVNLKTLETYQGLTNREIKKSTGADGKETYSIEIPKYLNLLYHLSNKQKTLSDMTMMASIIYASGHDSIIMSVNFSDPDLAIKKGRDAYEACIRAGFEPKNIVIKVNGHTYSPQEKNDKGKEVNTIETELFKEARNRYQGLDGTGKEVRKAIEEHKSRDIAPSNRVEEMKKELAGIVKEMPEPTSDATARTTPR